MDSHVEYFHENLGSYSKEEGDFLIFCFFLTLVVLGISGENFKEKFEEMKIQCTALRKRLAAARRLAAQL